MTVRRKTQNEMESIMPKNPSPWQQRTSVHSHQIYGKDFPQGSICLTDIKLMILEQGAEFDDFHRNSESIRRVRSYVIIPTLTVMEFVDYLDRFELGEHFHDIVSKWAEIRRK
jgi:hypothetical protein